MTSTPSTRSHRASLPTITSATNLTSSIASQRRLHPARHLDSHEIQRFGESFAYQLDDEDIEQPLGLVLFLVDAVPGIELAEPLGEDECVLCERSRLERHNNLITDLIEAHRRVQQFPNIVGVF